MNSIPRLLLVLAFTWVPLFSDDASPGPRIAQYEACQFRDSSLIALSGIGLGDVSPSVRMRLHILCLDTRRKTTEELFTFLKSPWAVGWISSSSLVVCGANDVDSPQFNVRVYEFKPSASAEERTPSSEEIAFAQVLFKAKHGKYIPGFPPPNKSITVTPTAVTPAAYAPGAPSAGVHHH